MIRLLAKGHFHELIRFPEPKREENNVAERGLKQARQKLKKSKLAEKGIFIVMYTYLQGLEKYCENVIRKFVY